MDSGALTSSRVFVFGGGVGEESDECCVAVEVYARCAGERVVAGREDVVVGREDVLRRQVCCEEGVELAIFLRGILDCLAVVLYVLALVEAMRSTHRDAEVAVRFIIALCLLCLFPETLSYVSL